MNPAKKKSPIIPILTSLVVLTGTVVTGGLLFWKTQTSPPVNLTQDAEFTVEPGTPGQEIGNQLAKAGLIESVEAWKIWTVLQQKKNPSGGFKAGTYSISKDDSLTDIADKIWRGEIVQTAITIPEGWSIEQMGKYFESKGYFQADRFIEATKNIPYDRYSWLPQNIPHLEGFLYPDTYKISSDRLQDPQAIINVMLDNFEKVALPVYKAAETEYSLVEWVTLASVVEKESVIQSERPLIAGVFTARLQKRIPLGSDPTVEYGLGIRQTADKPLTYAQVGTPSPYNTYRNLGLPPTAIASPGIASLKATLNPESTDYLYFVARYDGTHVFSKTLQEHEAATRKIRRERNNK